MAGKYFYHGVDINELIQSGGTTTPSGGDFFTGFPKCQISDLTTNFESCGLEGFIGIYKYQETSIQTPSGIGTPLNSNINKIVARYIDYNYTVGGSNDNIVITPPTFCSHISAFCYGGDGGGAGANSTTPRVGGKGGRGGYAAVEKVTITGDDTATIYLTIGKGGNGGAAKAYNTSGNSDGDDGNPGLSTILKIDNNTIITANGGGKGWGRIQNSENGNGVVDTANYGGISYYTQEAPGLAQKIARPFTGNGGGGGSRFTIGDPGGAGTHGFCRIYFLYNP